MSLPSNFPASPGPARDAVILDAIKSGNFSAAFAEITSSVAGHSATFYVFQDALKIGGVRISMSAYLEQTVADLLSCTLLTTKLSDLIFAQRTITLPPHTQTPDASMVTTGVMVAQSAWIDAQLAGRTGLPSTLGKQWVIDQLFATNSATKGKAINYGWHFDGLFNGSAWAKAATAADRVVQNPGWAHAPQEVDYSQNCILVSRLCVVDGVERDILDVYADPVLSYLANSSGVLKVTRQPGVPVVQPLSTAAPTASNSTSPGVINASATTSSTPSSAPLLYGAGLVGVGLGIFGGLKMTEKKL